MQAAGMDVKHSSHTQQAINSRIKGQNTRAAIDKVGRVIFAARLCFFATCSNTS